VPDYGRGALVIGGQGGEGALMVREGTKWTGPIFYNIGAVTIGAQVGGEGGSIAMLLMTDRALNRFKRDNNFSLIADADLTIVDYSAQAQESAANGDVVRWSDTEGAFAGASTGVTDINYDEDANKAYYRVGDVTSYRILHGEMANPHAETLAEALPG
jgi:lipid-binding SYLF domain-containing protein